MVLGSHGVVMDTPGGGVVVLHRGWGSGVVVVGVSCGDQEGIGPCRAPHQRGQHRSALYYAAQEGSMLRKTSCGGHWEFMNNMR